MQVRREEKPCTVEVIARGKSNDHDAWGGHGD